MHKKEKVHRKVHRKNRLKFLQKLFSEPKIYRAKKEVDGQMVVTVEKPWHVYYRYRNPETGILEKFIEKKGINRLKTVTAREEAARNLRRALKRYLQDGYNPFEFKVIEAAVNKEVFTTVEAIQIAFNQKCNGWKESTKDVNRIYVETFIAWLKKRNLDARPITFLTKKHISFYLGYLIEEKGVSKTSRNNHKRLLSSLFSELEEKEMIEDNFIKKIAFLKTTAKKNKPFNTQQLDAILSYLKEHDNYLYCYIKVMWYSFLRPIEIIRLKVDNVNLVDNVIDIDTKTEERVYVRLVKPLEAYFKTLGLEKHKPDQLLFTKDLKVGYWVTKKEKSREDWFSKRFKKVKEHFNLSEDYGVYSFRHTSALSIYYQFKNTKGMSEYQAVLKVQEIMRHKDEQTTRKYLREIGGQLPEDWSQNYDYEVL
ncbi:tyrosine-type recombinase/integrase [Tenacibaculum sp. 190130A14a]|uniref:Site-specific recombinase XerD n=1 Tax=Tenacibaculum polynesiense TaxID=3137857 RepID=A0ABP1F529_9FLAO